MDESASAAVGNEPEPVLRPRKRRERREKGGIALAVLGLLVWPLWVMAIPVCRTEIQRAKRAGRSTTLSTVALGVSIAGLVLTAVLYLALFAVMC